MNHYRGPLGGTLPIMASIKPASGAVCEEENRPNRAVLPLLLGVLPFSAVDGNSLVLHREGSTRKQGWCETHFLSTYPFPHQALGW